MNKYQVTDDVREVFAAPTNPKMRRVELYRDDDGLLVYKTGAWGEKYHVLAQGEEGFCGYEYEGWVENLYSRAMMYRSKSNQCPWGHASLEQLESGERVPVYPIAFCVWEGE